MASFQCYRPAQKVTCETKCHDNTFGHKVSQMAGMAFKENHHGHDHEHNANNQQGHFYGQSNGCYNHHPDHTISNTQSTVVKTQCTECVKNQSHGQNAGSHCQSHNKEHHSSLSHGNGMACCNGKTEKKMENRCEYKKMKSYGNKRRDGNESCNDSGSDSD